VSWDPNNWVRATALDAATSYLSDHAEPRLLRIIIESCEKEGMTGFAYNALYHIVGDPEGPPTTVIEMARERLAREEARNADS
jgi:hypothetical protein